MAESIQSLAEELARLNKNNTLWAQPQIQSQSGAAAAVTQNQPQMQDYMLQQYAYANPGGVAPAHMYADPRAANYALQQQHYLNPYQARFYGGQFNPNMPGAEYQTSSRLGIYRQGYQGPQAGGFAQPSLFGDVMTLSGYKSYAGYESPYHVQIAASRRMTERGESITNMGIMGLGLAAGMMLPGGIIPIAGTIAGEEALRATAGQYFQRRKETGEIYEVMQDLVSGSAATGLFGRGVAMRTAADMMRDMRSSAASDPLKSIEDYKSILKTGAATGLFNYEDSGGEVMGKVKQASKMVNMMMMLAEDPDIQSTVKRMADFQAMGVSINQMERMATDIKGFATLANASFEDVMTQGASLGAQQAQMMGGSAAFGMRVGGLAQGMANRVLQSGYLNPMQVARRGGKSGLMQSMTSLMTNQVHSMLGPRAAFLMDQEGNLDEDALQSMIAGNAGDTIGKSVSNFNRMNPYTYLMNYGDVVAEAQSKLSSMDTLRLMEADKRKWMQLTGITDENAYYYARGGDTGAASLKYMMSNQNKLDILRNERHLGIEKAAKTAAETRMKGLWHNRILTAGGQIVNELFDSDLYSDIAERQDRAAQGRAWGIYRRPREDWGGSRRFQQFMRKEAERLRFSDARNMEGLMQTRDEDIGFFEDMVSTDQMNPYIEGMYRAADRGYGLRVRLYDSLLPGDQYFEPNQQVKDSVRRGMLSFRKSLVEVQKDPRTRRVMYGAKGMEEIENTLEGMVSSGGYLNPAAFAELKYSNPELHRKILIHYAQGGLPAKLQSALTGVMHGYTQGMENLTDAQIENLKESAGDFIKSIGGTEAARAFGEIVATGADPEIVADILAGGELTNDGAGRKFTKEQWKMIKQFKKGKSADQIRALSASPTKRSDALKYMALTSTVHDAGFVDSLQEFLTSTEAIGLSQEAFEKKVQDIKETSKLSKITLEEGLERAKEENTQVALRGSTEKQNLEAIGYDTSNIAKYVAAMALKGPEQATESYLREQASKHNYADGLNPMLNNSGRMIRRK